ncbi:MAG: hypothetical protein AB8B85_14130 [Paracoccaceae bacterium]
MIRHARESLCVQYNALFLRDLVQKQCNTVKMFAEWPVEDFIGLLDMLKNNGASFGGNSASCALGQMGRDGFVLGGNCVKASVRERVVDKAPTSQEAPPAVQMESKTRVHNLDAQWLRSAAPWLVQLSRVAKCNLMRS